MRLKYLEQLKSDKPHQYQMYMKYMKKNQWKINLIDMRIDLHTSSRRTSKLIWTYKHHMYRLSKPSRARSTSICCCQSQTVFDMSIATVRGPTPPGTGVAKAHTFLAYSLMSPHNRPSESLLMPISIAIDPGFRLFIRFGFPTAAITISACIVSSYRLFV